MNSLRNIFSVRALNFLRQNGQNALINVTQQQVDNGATFREAQPSTTSVQKQCTEPLLIPKTIIDATRFTGKKLYDDGTKKTNSISPTTLKLYQRIQRKMDIVYTCKLCNTRNTKQINEAAYTNGVVILQCDGCSVNHLIIDNLGWFANTKDKSFNDVLAENTKRIKVIKVNEHDELI